MTTSTRDVQTFETRGKHKRLYHFTSAEAAQSILSDRGLNISFFNAVNDPFELMCVSMEDKKVRHIATTRREHLVNSKGLLCFSDSWRSPVMWAHYADKHTGICFGFDVLQDPKRLHKVEYKSNRLIQSSQYQNESDGFHRRLFATKAWEWHYESEYRLIFNLDEPQTEESINFQMFDDKIRLRQIIIGQRNNNTPTFYEQLIGQPDYGVDITKARAAFTSFNMVQNKTVTRISVKGSSSKKQTTRL